VQIDLFWANQWEQAPQYHSMMVPMTYVMMQQKMTTYEMMLTTYEMMQVMLVLKQQVKMTY
jgi:hypothetical protein